MTNTIEYLENVTIGIAKDIEGGKLKVNRERTGAVNKIKDYVIGIVFVKDKYSSPSTSNEDVKCDLEPCQKKTFNPFT